MLQGQQLKLAALAFTKLGDIPTSVPHKPSFWHFFRKSSTRNPPAAIPRERFVGPRRQSPPGDPAADALRRPQHHHVRRLSEPVVDVQVSVASTFFDFVLEGASLKKKV